MLAATIRFIIRPIGDDDMPELPVIKRDDSNRSLFFYLTFLADILLLGILIANGTSIAFSIVVAETAGWMLRLIWINPALLSFIIRRILHMIPIIFIVLTFGFLLIQLAPGDIYSEMAMNPDIQPETLERFRSSFGLDKPWHIQLFYYLRNAVQGNFGYSELYKAPVFTLVSQRASNTLLLAILSFVLAWAFSIPAGIICATHQYKWQDQLISVLAFMGMSLPGFFMAFLLIYLIASTGNWLPIGGMFSADVNTMGPVEKFFDLIKHLIVPVLILGTETTAHLTRIMRANMLEIMNMQYITTARSKGLKERTVIYGHALQNAINPMITIFGLQLGSLLGGAALVESVLSWPGLGRLILEALMSQDVFLVMGSLIYGVILLMIGNLISDILLGTVDPRVRLS